MIGPIYLGFLSFKVVLLNDASVYFIKSVIPHSSTIVNYIRVLIIFVIPWLIWLFDLFCPAITIFNT